MFDDSYTYDGRTEKDILQEAFNRIMNGVELPQPARAALFDACFTDLDRRKLEGAAISILVGTPWKWLDLNKWGMVFKERKKYPSTM